MKRFLVFGGDCYPSGGLEDFIDEFDMLEDAEACALGPDYRRYDWSHVYDSEMGVIASNFRDGKKVED